ncbi:Dna2-domain-containing protein [Panus rudis PR-1116 ss-1]|nr:Dna2-domain-containing protein [Panus rudis PR-1116 ss-1]
MSLYHGSLSPSVSSITISAHANYLILHPDLLITATSISGAPQCRRKPLLSNLVRSSSDVTPALVWGNILHEVMQLCLADGDWSEKAVDERIEDNVDRCLDDLLRLNVSAEHAKREVKIRAKGLKTFSERYIGKVPKPEAILTNTRAKPGQTSLLAISDLHDIEEDIWSPTYGLKGKLDASVEAVISETDTTLTPFTIASRKPPALVTESHKMPLEIKTGRAVAGMEHRAQTMLYTLLMAERYKTEVHSGLLYYTQSEEVVRVPAARNELRALLAARNEMAAYMMRRIHREDIPRVKHEERGKEDDSALDVKLEAEPFLPPTINDQRICGKCYALDACMLYRKAVEQVEDIDSEIADMYALKTSHLTPSQCEFFKKWENLISLEEQDLVKFKKELWTMGAAEREDKGRCFSDMLLDTSYEPPDALKSTSKREGKIHQYTYRFMKANAKETSLLNGHMGKGDAINVSVEPDLLAFARGFILDLTPQQVILGVDHEVNLDAIHLRQQTPTSQPIVFRIDKDEFSGGMSRIRENLAQLFYADGDIRRLELVVDLRKPRFFPHEGPLVAPQEPVAKTIAKLNSSQQQAIRKVLSAEDYALILGMPGTGKTTVIAALIRVLVASGKSVLLTSYTHSAVDNILMKLKPDADFGMLRIGNIDKIHPEIREYTLAAYSDANSVEQLEKRVMAPLVVATTCLSIDQNRDARKGGMDVSLFRRLSDAHPEAVVDLTEQYRMNEDIMLLSNKLIYGDRLVCGSKEVAQKGLTLPDHSFLKNLHANSACDGFGCWLQRLLDENTKAVFVDTDAVPAFDSRVGDLVQNVTEAHLVQQLTEALVRSGIEENQIGILSLYRQQIKLLSYLLQDKPDVEILTADRSQGRDKDCIIISMVRSNESKQIGDLVRDWRRMNVSFTRARSKLVLFGSRQTLQTDPLLSQFFDLMDSKGWIMSLPPNADKLHIDITRTPTKKRPASQTDSMVAPNDSINTRPQKKTRKSKVTEEALVKGRPMLHDVLNNEKGARRVAPQRA